MKERETEYRERQSTHSHNVTYIRPVAWFNLFSALLVITKSQSHGLHSRCDREAHITPQYTCYTLQPTVIPSPPCLLSLTYGDAQVKVLRARLHVEEKREGPPPVQVVADEDEAKEPRGSEARQRPRLAEVQVVEEEAARQLHEPPPDAGVERDGQARVVAEPSVLGRLHVLGDRAHHDAEEGDGDEAVIGGGDRRPLVDGEVAGDAGLEEGEGREWGGVWVCV